MSYFYQIVCGGLHNGMLYAVLAYSYVLMQQVLPKPNLAHGAFFAFSAQIFVLAVNFAYSILIFTFASSLGFALFATALFSGFALTIFVLGMLPGFSERSPNMMIVATLAVAIVLMEAVRIAAEGRDFWLAPITTAQIHFGLGANLSTLQVGNIATMAAMIALAELVLANTSAGRAIRAMSQDRLAAQFCAINVERVTAITTAAASGMSMIAGLLAVLYFGNMSFGAGLTYGLKVLFIASAGGFTAPRHAAFAAFAYGEAEALWDGYMSILWRDVFFFGLLAFILVIRGNVEKRL
jgi:branched-chain amino acid transport system permease protein